MFKALEKGFAGCNRLDRTGVGLSWDSKLHSCAQVYELMRWDDDFTETVMHTANYIIDCQDPGSWALSLVVR